jgi:hypothetical protein
MLGEHPEMYGFPELQLFIGDTVCEAIKKSMRRGSRTTRAYGLLRSLAQIHEGEQTTAGVVRAEVWLNERLAWTTKRLRDYLFEKVSPLAVVEKDPRTVARHNHIERVYECYPNAYFLHLTRHPVSARQSLREFFQLHPAMWKPSQTKQIEELMVWHMLHTNIIGFTSTLPTGQTMRVRGEDILSDPDVFLPQIAEWMGLRTDREAIEAMKHPENSPYACVGPAFARGGNDLKFMESPALRPGKAKQHSLVNFFEKHPEITWVSEALEKGPLRTADDEVIKEHVADLAALLGYW